MREPIGWTSDEGRTAIGAICEVVEPVPRARCKPLAPIVDLVQHGAQGTCEATMPKPRIDLVQWLWEEFGVSVSEATVGWELRGFRKLSARPRH